MNKWKAYAQINGNGVSYFPIYEFEIEDDLYEKVMQTINAGVSLQETELYYLLKYKAEENLDWSFIFDPNDIPKKDSYDSDEEYEEAMEEYQKDCERIKEDRYCLEVIDIYDPGDITRLKNYFIGKQYPEWANGKQYDIEIQLEDEAIRIAKYSITVSIDENGTIIDMGDVFSVALESESFTRATYVECYPDYDNIQEGIEEFFDYEFPEDYWEEDSE